MGLFQNLLETYEKCKDATGIQKSADGEQDEKKTFLPIFHMTFKSQICIILDENGTFADATRDSKDTTIIVPCTVESAGRSSGIAAHPLCDQLDYLAGINEKKTKKYLDGLGGWEEQAEGATKVRLQAIYSYVGSGKMLVDLENKQLFKESEYDTKEGVPFLNHEKIRKIGVRFAVEMKNDPVVNVWEDKELQQSWIEYRKLQFNGQEEELFDYLDGMPVGEIASQHPKNINSMTGNAKLLSCNDMSGYTFRGRFSSQDEAVIIDYEQSQKMHQTLRWLINNHGYNTDTQTIIAWAVDVDTKPPIDLYQDSFHMLWSYSEPAKTDVEKLSDAETEIYADYGKNLRKVLMGYGKGESIKKHRRRICIAAFDAATTGRMGLTFYHELLQDEYLENIVRWHDETRYYLTAWVKGKDEKGKEKSFPRHYIGAPSYDDILFAV